MVGVTMPLDTRATLRPDAEQAERAILGGTRMARRRFQHGSLFQGAEDIKSGLLAGGRKLSIQMAPSDGRGARRF